jgi:sigma-B regulation protein RsbU (phosphoserine phosphatase)
MSSTHRIRCAEIWGGNRGDELQVETSGLRACLYSRACDGGKGGDVYFLSVCGSDLLTRIAIADVVGHGEVVAETSQWLYDALEKRMNTLEGNEVLADLNRLTVEKGFSAMSTATTVGFYRSDDHLHFSYAGHHELLICPKGETKWRTLAIADTEGLVGLPLGVDEDCEFEQQSARVSVGDRIFLYTDGLIEAADAAGQLYDVERLLDVLNGNHGNSLTAIRQAVLDGLREHTGGHLDHDDVTFMVIEIAPEDLA